jgi:Fic family protein
VARPPRKPPSLDSLFDQKNGKPIFTRPDVLFRSIGALMEGQAAAAQGHRYLHWDDLRHRDPPGGLTHEEWWLALKFQRVFSSQQLPLLDGRGLAFAVAMPDAVIEVLQRVDSALSGRIEMHEQVSDPATRDRFVVSALMEEAIASSQLEGASTTRRVAKEMLRTARSPRTTGELMISNNYKAMLYVREHFREPLSRSHVLQLHEIVTHGAIQPADAAGRLRRDDERVRVFDHATGEIVHDPPAAKELERRLETLVRFANGDAPGRFVHPVVRAIAVHFGLAYDHPFVDGNGRTARALFQWTMLRHDYWLAEFLSPSVVAHRAPGAYARAFRLVESDDNDLTYFVLQQLDALQKAVKELEAYLARKQRELREAESLLRNASRLNHRQLALVSHALRHADAEYTIESHGNSHQVAYATSRGDLLDLARHRLLGKRKLGKRFIFSVPTDLARRIERLR